MNNSEKYKKAFHQYYDTVMDDTKVLQTCKTKKCTKISTIRKWSLAFASFLFLLSGATLVSAAAGWINFADIFQNVFQDSTSAELVNEGIVQDLAIADENEYFDLKLVAFTGDMETHIAMFKLTPKKDLGEFNEIILKGKTITPEILEEGLENNYAFSEIKGSELVFNEDNSSYYFSYELPPYWVKYRNDDIVLQIKNVNLYNNHVITKRIDCDMSFQFTPNRSMLEVSKVTVLNQVLTKDIYDIRSLSDDYSQNFYNTEEIVSPTSEKSILFTDIIISNYKTIINGTILEEDIGSDSANIIWDQFTHPKYITHHYWNGLENKNAYELVVVDNTDRLRLFVDNVEIPIIEDSLSYIPGKGHDENGEITEGYNGCAIEFNGFDYDAAQKIEIHFGDRVIPIK